MIMQLLCDKRSHSASYQTKVNILGRAETEAEINNKELLQYMGIYAG